jgi:SAM-dependent methyltransferase
MSQDNQDAYGHLIYDYHQGKDSYEIVERDDSFFSLSSGPELYFLGYEEWPEAEKEAMKYIQGRVLDIGCGAGRHSLYLQERGFDVLGIDNSPLVLKVCKARGLRKTQLLPVTQVNRQIGVFDTLLMMGNNFALLGNIKRARWLLKRFQAITSDTGRIIAQTRDPYQTDTPEHLEYHARNRERGRMPGEARIRVRYKRYVTPWFDFLMVSQQEMITLLEGTNWVIRDFLDGQGGGYIAVIEKRKT